MNDFERETTERIELEGEFAEVSPVEEKGGIKGKLATLGALGVILFKLKGVIFLVLAKLKFVVAGLKFLKFGQVFTTMGSMIFTIVIDAIYWGWAFAVGFVLLLFVHELGHLIAIRLKGMNAGAPVFIPFVGAVIALKDMPMDAKTEAEIGIGGPLLGSLGAYACYLLGQWTGYELLTRLAYVGFFLNLFNLLPVLPLDGGRIMSAISPKVWIVGLVLMVLYFLISHNPLILVIVLLAGHRMWHVMKMSPEEQEYYNVPRRTRIGMTIAYFGLAFFLGSMMVQLHHGAQSAPPHRIGLSNIDHRASGIEHRAGISPGV